MTLYKYYPNNENSVKAIYNKYFWCTNPFGQNDINDSMIQDEIKLTESQKAAVDRWSKIEYNKRRGLPIDTPVGSILSPIEFVNLFYKELLRGIFTASFTEIVDSQLMWSHYANEHRGFALGFKIEPESADFSRFLPISYGKNSENFPLDSLIGLNSNGYGPHHDNLIKTFEIIKFASNKDTDWSYEKEWRIWRDEHSRIYPFPPSIIKSVYFGVRCDEAYKSQIITILNGHRINYDQYHMKHRNGKLEVCDIL